VFAATTLSLCHGVLWVGLSVLSVCGVTAVAASASTPTPPRADLAASSTAVSPPKTPIGQVGTVSVWVDLDLPALAEVPLAERAALRSNILAQQALVMRGLQALGAHELTRVQQVRNAVAVRLDAAQIDAASALPGVRSVRIVRNIERQPPVSTTPR
jgi:hypothetical protein